MTRCGWGRGEWCLCLFFIWPSPASCTVTTYLVYSNTSIMYMKAFCWNAGMRRLSVGGQVCCSILARGPTGVARTGRCALLRPSKDISAFSNGCGQMAAPGMNFGARLLPARKAVSALFIGRGPIACLGPIDSSTCRLRRPLQTDIELDLKLVSNCVPVHPTRCRSINMI